MCMPCWLGVAEDLILYCNMGFRYRKGLWNKFPQALSWFMNRNCYDEFIRYAFCEPLPEANLSSHCFLLNAYDSTKQHTIKTVPIHIKTKNNDVKSIKAVSFALCIMNITNTASPNKPEATVDPRYFIGFIRTFNKNSVIPATAVARGNVAIYIKAP